MDPNCMNVIMNKSEGTIEGGFAFSGLHAEPKNWKSAEHMWMNTDGFSHMLLCGLHYWWFPVCQGRSARCIGRFKVNNGEHGLWVFITGGLLPVLTWGRTSAPLRLHAPRCVPHCLLNWWMNWFAGHYSLIVCVDESNGVRAAERWIYSPFIDQTVQPR